VLTHCRRLYNEPELRNLVGSPGEKVGRIRVMGIRLLTSQAIEAKRE